MSITEFNDTISRLINQEPFQPFVVEKMDGSIIEIRNHCVPLSGEGSAGHLTDDGDLVEFDCSEVRAVRLLAPEIAA